LLLTGAVFLAAFDAYIANVLSDGSCSTLRSSAISTVRHDNDEDVGFRVLARYPFVGTQHSSEVSRSAAVTAPAS